MIFLWIQRFWLDFNNFNSAQFVLQVSSPRPQPQSSALISTMMFNIRLNADQPTTTSLMKSKDLFMVNIFYYYFEFSCSKFIWWAAKPEKKKVILFLFPLDGLLSTQELESIQRIRKNISYVLCLSLYNS